MVDNIWTNIVGAAIIGAKIIGSALRRLSAPCGVGSLSPESPGSPQRTRADAGACSAATRVAAWKRRGPATIS